MAHYGVPGLPMMIEGSGAVPPVPFQQPLNVFRFGEQTIWSTLCLPTGAIANQQFRVFSTQLNGTGQGFTAGLSIAETNLKQPGMVPNGVAYDVFGVASEIVLAATGGPDFLIGDELTAGEAQIKVALNIQHNSVLSWDFTQTNVDICPVTLAGAGGGLYGALALNAAATSSGQMNNGAGSIWLYRKHPVALPGTSTFAILVRIGSRAAAIPAAVDAATLRVTLLGYYKNVVEIG
jgi:hypothetical protein